MLKENSALFEYMVRHYRHHVAEPSSGETIGWSEEELTALADSFDLETKLRALLGCEHPICDRFLRHHAQEILDDIFEIEDRDLFCASTRQQIAAAINRRRCKRCLTPVQVSCTPICVR